MTAITFLLVNQSLSQTKRTELLDPLLDSAVYSYTARSSSPYYAIRTTLIAIELLTQKGGTAPDDAVKWAARALGTGSLGDTASCLVIERIAACYQVMNPRRRRKMALWSMLACEAWMGIGCREYALRCLKDAFAVYREAEGFGRIGGHVAGLMESLGWVKAEQVGEDIVDLQRVEETVDMQHGDGTEGITVEFA
jgi:hypothetical protein